MVRLLSLGLLAMTASGSVTVRKTGKGPTGYEVDFKYINQTASNVTVASGMLFTDQFHASGHKVANYAPSEYKPGYFRLLGWPKSSAGPYDMKADGYGVWTLTTPLPSGTYMFNYMVGCDNCSSIDFMLDPDLPRFENVPGDQRTSTFHVPFDPEFQLGDPLVNQDYALEAPDGQCGTVQSVNYTSPGSIWPAPNVHDFSIYLPVGYGKEKDKKYPLLYLSHGAYGNGAEWQLKGRASHILDNLIAGGHLEPTVVVMPSFYNLQEGLPVLKPGDGYIMGLPLPQLEDVRKNFQDHLFPYIEENYDVCNECSCRAFAGLSWGASLAYEMWVNATDYFDYIGFFSLPYMPTDSRQRAAEAIIQENPTAAKKGFFMGFGLYESGVTSLDLQRSLDVTHTEYVTRITPFGEHFWTTWQDHLWWFGVKSLWKPITDTNETTYWRPISNKTAPVCSKSSQSLKQVQFEVEMAMGLVE